MIILDMIGSLDVFFNGSCDYLYKVWRLLSYLKFQYDSLEVLRVLFCWMNYCLLMIDEGGRILILLVLLLLFGVCVLVFGYIVGYINRINQIQEVINKYEMKRR